MRISSVKFSFSLPTSLLEPRQVGALNGRLLWVCFGTRLLISFLNRIIQLRMPRGDFNVHFASRGRSGYVRAEEAAGIALLVLILVALLILGCWYFRRRSGYKIIRSPRSGMSWRTTMNRGHEEGAGLENKVPLTDFSSLQPAVPNAPPAYEKIASSQPPPPYSP